MQSYFEVDLIKHNTEGFLSYRIPGIVCTATGTLLAYWEARKQTSNDWSARAIPFRRSTDGGKSWTPMTILVESEEKTVGNPLMIATKSGLIYFFWIEEMRKPFFQISRDDGLTFEEPISLAECMERYRKDVDWTLFGFGPGHGIELENGRLIVPLWFSTGKGNAHAPSCVGSVSSGDSGKSWQLGAVIRGETHLGAPFRDPNETQAVELTDGRVLFNIRHTGSCRHRFISISPGGRSGFSVPVPDKTLIDPICFGSIVRSGSDIFFVNCANDQAGKSGWGGRIHLTVRRSEDDCRTWISAREIALLGGYADLAASPDEKWIYCLYEYGRAPDASGDPLELHFCQFNREWLAYNPKIYSKKGIL